MQQHYHRNQCTFSKNKRALMDTQIACEQLWTFSYSNQIRHGTITGFKVYRGMEKSRFQTTKIFRYTVSVVCAVLLCVVKDRKCRTLSESHSRSLSLSMCVCVTATLALSLSPSMCVCNCHTRALSLTMCVCVCVTATLALSLSPCVCVCVCVCVCNCHTRALSLHVCVCV